VTSNSLEPGIVATNLSAGITDDPAMRKQLENGVSVEEGALTHIHLASSDTCNGVSGEHWMECAIISQGFSKLRYIVAAHHLRASVGPALWEHTQKLLAPTVARTENNEESVRQHLENDLRRIELSQQS